MWLNILQGSAGSQPNTSPLPTASSPGRGRESASASLTDEQTQATSRSLQRSGWAGKWPLGDRRVGDRRHLLQPGATQCVAFKLSLKEGLGGPRMSNFNLFNVTSELRHECLRNGKERPALPFHTTTAYTRVGNSELVFQFQLHESQKRTNLLQKDVPLSPPVSHLLFTMHKDLN